MIEPMAAAYGTVDFRQTILIHVIADAGNGWGECVAFNQPLYSSEWSNGEWELLRELFVPTLLNEGEIEVEDLREILAPFKQHNSSKCALEMAVLDAKLKSENRSLAQHFGASNTSVECSYVLGLFSGDALMHSVQRALKFGYKDFKLKIAPGRDVERIAMVQKEFPDISLRVDCNASYDWDNLEHKRMLFEIDKMGLTLIEQPFHPDRLLAVQDFIRAVETPVGMDESLTSPTRVMNCMEMGLCDVLILKPGMIGGYLVAREMQVEAGKRGLPTMVGGMVETSVARSANLALAASGEHGDYPAEISPDGRWFDDRLNVEPVTMDEGCLAVPNGAGIVGDFNWDVVDRLTTRVHVTRAGARTTPFVSVL
jgi:o-succinylbenzoate synthase